MALLPPEHVAKLSEMFADLVADVTLVHYTQKASRLVVPGTVPCPSCRETEELLHELAAASPRLFVETHDFAAEAEGAAAAGIDKIPATVVRGAHGDGRVRFYGMPAGYEFASLIEAVLAAGSKAVDLLPATTDKLRGLGGDVHIQVFVSPT